MASPPDKRKPPPNPLLVLTAKIVHGAIDLMSAGLSLLMRSAVGQAIQHSSLYHYVVGLLWTVYMVFFQVRSC